MASFSENGISSGGRYVSTVDSLPRDPNPSASGYMKHFNTSSDVDSGSSVVPQGGNMSNLRSGIVLNNFQPDSNKSNSLDKYQSSSVDMPSGWMSDGRDASAVFTDESFAENPDGSFTSWKKCSGNLQQNRFYFENRPSAPQMLIQPSDYNYRLFIHSDTPFNSNNVASPVDRVFPGDSSNASWCQNTWIDQNLGPSSDRNCAEWPKSLQEPVPEVNSLFHPSPAFKSWRVRTSSDGGGANGKNPQAANRSGQNACGMQNHPIHHRKRGRTTSGTSNPSTDASPNSEANRSINLPTGQNVNSSDFDAPASLSESMARISLVSDLSTAGQRPPVMSTANTSDSMAQIMLGGQALPNMDKSQFFMNHSLSNFWSTTTQEGVPGSGMGSMVFNQKMPSFHRPSTSDQFTQHDTVGGYRSTCGFSNPPSNGLEQYMQQQQQQQQQQQPVQSRDDDKLWYYQDPSGQIQGEFSSMQMNNWFMAGRYFTPALRIRRKCDDTFSTLQHYCDLYGQVPFSSALKVPPIRGAITPDLIACFRTFQSLGPNAAALFANLENDPIYQKLVRDTGLSVMDASFGGAGFGKNGTNATSPSAAAAVTVAKLLEMVASPVNFNDPFSLFSEWIAKGRVDQLALQEVVTKVGANSLGSSWPTPLQSQLMAQIQLFMQAQQQHSNDNSLPDNALQDSPNGLMVNGSQSGEMAIPGSPTDTVHIQTDNHSPKSAGHKMGPETSETKLKKTPHQQPIGCKSDSATESIGNQQQHERSGRTWPSVQEQAQFQSVASKPIKSCWTERGGTAVLRAAAGDSSQPMKTSKQISPTTAGKTKTSQNVPEVGGSGKKKNKQRQSSPARNESKKTENGSDIGGSKKSKGSNDNPIMTEELKALIRWTQQALSGAEWTEKIDLPTLVEVLITIDGPYEVESMLLSYLANTPRAKQFVKDFLDRRHTCWQQHRKRMEEMENQKKGQNGQRNNSTDTNAPESSGYASRAYQEVNESQTENAWRQIKPRGGCGRRAKKGTKNR